MRGVKNERRRTHYIQRGRSTRADTKSFHSILKKYQRLEVIFLLAKLNCMLGTWQNAPRFDLDIQFSNYLLRAFDAELQRLRQVKPYKVAFSRLSILFLLKQAAFACPPTGALLKTRSAHSDMGVCVLLANDLLFPFLHQKPTTPP